jgi:phosphatidylserine/phosphatidylglycerophosphate/cardiolipin synthase-like enzyme
MHRAHRIELSAYVLRSKSMVRALEGAAKAGARVKVRLEATPYADKGGRLARLNRDTIAKLRATGADARLVDRFGGHLNHMKAAVVDGVAFLDDRNWPMSAGNTIVADDDQRDVHVVRDAIRGKIDNPHNVAVTKGAALSQEAALLSARGSRRGVAVETESFTAGTAPYRAIRQLALSGVPVRLLICEHDLKRGTEAATRALARDGVTVRVTRSAEKIAVASDRAWIGSANATYGRDDQIDWGATITDAVLRARLQARFNSTWRYARPLC